MRILHTLMIGTAALTAGASPARASGGDECEPHFVDSSLSINLTADEFGPGSFLREDFTLRIRNDDDDDSGASQSGSPMIASGCTAYLRIANRGIGGGSGDLELNFQAAGRRIEILPDDSGLASAPGDILIANIPEGASGRKLPVRLAIPTEWGLGAGRYDREFIVSLHGASGQLFDEMVLHVNVTIAPSVAMRIVGASGNGSVRTINLGFLDPGNVNRSDPFGLRVWSTSPYRVEFESRNQGNLRHAEGRGSIPYQLWMDGGRIALEARDSRTYPDKTNALGDLHRLRVRVEPFFSAAGNYRDRVEVTVSAI